MLIETYKGVQIHHNAELDEFYTNIVINKKSNGKKEFIRAGRLQKTRDEIDKFLNTAAKKPAVQKAWLRKDDHFELVDVILYNNISKKFMIKKAKSQKPEELGERRYGSEQLYIKSKENDAIVHDLIKKNAEIEKIKKTTSCAMGKLIPLSEEFSEDDD